MARRGNGAYPTKIGLRTLCVGGGFAAWCGPVVLSELAGARSMVIKLAKKRVEGRGALGKREPSYSLAILSSRAEEAWKKCVAREPATVKNSTLRGSAVANENE